MPNNVIPTDPAKVDLTIVEDVHGLEFLIIKTETGGAFAPKSRVIATCGSRPDAEAIVYWVREGLTLYHRDLVQSRPATTPLDKD